MTRLDPAHPLYLAPIARSDEPPHDLHGQDDGEPASEWVETLLLIVFALGAFAVVGGILIFTGVLPL